MSIADERYGIRYIYLVLWVGFGLSACFLQPCRAKVLEGSIPWEKVIEAYRAGTLQLPTKPHPGEGGREGFGNPSLFSHNNWKKDFFVFCRENKQEIEMKPDPRLIHSSLSVAHWDHVMEIASAEANLSPELLSALENAIRSKQASDRGECPDLVIGLNKLRLRRFPGAPIEEFVVSVPHSDEGSRAWPVFLEIDKQRLAARDGYKGRSGLIDIWWHTALNKNADWKSYIALLSILKEKLFIDIDRIYLHGKCINAFAAMSLALQHPDHWAEGSVSTNSSCRYLAGNALNLPFLFVRGEYDGPFATANYGFALKCFQSQDCRNLKHSTTQTVLQVRGTDSPSCVRQKSPAKLSYTIESLHYPEAYWVRIQGREDENQVATVQASVEGQEVRIETHNVDAYSINLMQAPVDANEPVQIIENGKPLGVTSEAVFIRWGGKYTDAEFLKNPTLSGPIRDAFTESYVVVYGSGRGPDSKYAQTCKRFALELAHGAPCVEDKDFQKHLIQTHNVIVVGSVGANLWLGQALEDLPIQIRGGKVLASHGQSYTGRDLGYMLVYPNPLNQKKYVVVYSATSTKAMARMSHAHSEMQTGISTDTGIFEIAKTTEITWLARENFNTIWNWHSQYDNTVAELQQVHPTWQWKQWLASAIKTEMGVDVVICEDHFRNTSVFSPGKKSYRDFFNAFENVWLIKVKLDGKTLRKLIATPLTSKDKRKAETRVIAGLGRISSPSVRTKNELLIGELAEDRLYTAVLPARCLSGNRLGVSIIDYEILGQAYLLPILKAHFMSNSNMEIDTQVAAQKPNIF